MSDRPEMVQHQSKQEAAAAALQETGSARHVVVVGNAQLVYLPGKERPILAPVRGAK
jgi:hypothetical protein